MMSRSVPWYFSTIISLPLSSASIGGASLVALDSKASAQKRYYLRFVATEVALPSKCVLADRRGIAGFHHQR